MPKISSSHMLRWGLVLTLIGLLLALTASFWSPRINDEVSSYSQILIPAVAALQRIAFVGGLFMLCGSWVVRHFEVLEQGIQERLWTVSGTPGD